MSGRSSEIIHGKDPGFLNWEWGRNCLRTAHLQTPSVYFQDLSVLLNKPDAGDDVVVVPTGISMYKI
jgi:hypothetical protein